MVDPEIDKKLLQDCDHTSLLIQSNISENAFFSFVLIINSFLKFEAFFVKIYLNTFDTCLNIQHHLVLSLSGLTKSKSNFFTQYS